MTTSSDVLIEGQHIAPKVFDDCRRRHSQESEKTENLPTQQHLRDLHNELSLLDGHAFAEWRFDLVQHTHELVDVMYASSDG